jgi:hypothetical protein
MKQLSDPLRSLLQMVCIFKTSILSAEVWNFKTENWKCMTNVLVKLKKNENFRVSSTNPAKDAVNPCVLYIYLV